MIDYAKSPGPQKELEKVAGRYEEIVLLNISQVITLSAAALGGRRSNIPKEFADRLVSTMNESLNLEYSVVRHPEITLGNWLIVFIQCILLSFRS